MVGACPPRRCKVCRNASGLYWGNYNAVCGAYEKARASVLKKRSRGEPAQLNFHRFDGQGRLVNQIQGGMTVEKLLAGGHSQAQIVLPEAVVPATRRDSRGFMHASNSGRPWHRRDGGHNVASLTVLAFRDWKDIRAVTFPLMMDRPFPDGAVIKEVYVHRRKIANGFRWTATFLCRTPAPKLPKPTGVPVAINVGWRATGNTLRVATVMGEGDRKAEFILLPEEIVTVPDMIEEMESRRDLIHNAMAAALRAYDFSDAPPLLAEAVAKLRTIPVLALAPRHTARIARAWRDVPDWQSSLRLWDLGKTDAYFARWRQIMAEHPSGARRREKLAGASAAFREIEDWRAYDKHLWLTVSHQRDKTQARRRDFYRNVAARICDRASIIIMNKFDIGKSARLGDDNPLATAARRNRVIAAVHDLRTQIVNCAKRCGIPVEIPDEGTTGRYSHCNTRFKPSDPAALIQQCRCGHAFDQDEEADRIMLAFCCARPSMAAE
jgi:hypothetical protein